MLAVETHYCDEKHQSHFEHDGSGRVEKEVTPTEAGPWTLGEELGMSGNEVSRISAAPTQGCLEVGGDPSLGDMKKSQLSTTGPSRTTNFSSETSHGLQLNRNCAACDWTRAVTPPSKFTTDMLDQSNSAL